MYSHYPVYLRGPSCTWANPGDSDLGPQAAFRSNLCGSCDSRKEFLCSNLPPPPTLFQLCFMRSLHQLARVDLKNISCTVRLSIVTITGWTTHLPCPSPNYLFEPSDLLLQLCLPRPTIVLLESHAAASASSLLCFKFKQLQVLQLLPEVLNQLQQNKGD